jgi:hypothetical protein
MNKQYDLDYYPNDLPELEEIDWIILFYGFKSKSNIYNIPF